MISEDIELKESTDDLMSPVGNGDGRKGGCTLSLPMAFVLLLLAVILSVGVGIIVFFATGNDKAKCADPAEGTSDTGAQIGSSDQGVWWPDKECLTTCISQGYCSEGDITGKSTETTPIVTTKSTEEVTTTATPTTAATTTTMPTTTAPDDKPDKIRDVRLPLWLLPVHYDVEMKPDIYQSDPEKFTNTGEVSVLMDCVEETDLITIHINKLTVTNYTLTEEGGGSISMPNIPVYDKDRQFVNFTLAVTLTKGKQYRLTLGYEGPLNNDLAGLYYSSYDVIDSVTNVTSKRYIATTQYQPTDARKAFPCFDEPALKATFTISLWRKEHYTALGNMPLNKTDPVTTGGWVKDTFDPTVKMSTYLLAMIVCDFKYKNATTDKGVEFKVWARESAIDQVNYALEQGVSILEHFEVFFNESFPLPKQDMIAIPDFASGAMENWGLITYRETALLYDKDVSAASNKQRVVVVVAHELAHQWFGNLVSPSWWDDLWLNEGFASYVEYIGVDHVHPDWKMMEQFVSIDVHNTLKSDSLATSHPIYVEVQHPDEINEIFDSISYGKGGSLIRMMRYFLGDIVFQRALSKYIDNKAYDVAHHDHLWEAMQDEANKYGLKDDRGNDLDVKGVLDTWILQMGYPLLEVVTEPTSGSIQPLKITQKHFLLDDTQEPDPKYPSSYSYTWDVPISYVTSKDPNFDVNETSVSWFFRTEQSKSIELDIDTDWLIINPKQYGFYRVNYPEAYWQKLIDQQMTNHTVIDPLNRAQIIDDAFNIALAGKLGIKYAMDLTKYLSTEDDYFPWKATITSLAYVSSALRRTEAYGDFKSYYSFIILPYYNKFNNGWVFNSLDPIVEQYRQSASISQACSYDVADCRTKATELLQKWMKTPNNNEIHPNVRTTVYCYGVKKGGADAWDFIYKRFQTENVAGEAVKLLQSLGCTDETWLLQRLLNYAADDDKIRKQDSYTAVAAVARNSLGRFLAWDWVRANWEILTEKYSAGINMLSRFVTSTTNSFFTEFDLEQIEAFTVDKGDLGTATRAFAQAKEKTRNNIKYLKQNQADLSEWLKDNKP